MTIGFLAPKPFVRSRQRPAAWLAAAATIAQWMKLPGKAARLRRILPNKSFTVAPIGATTHCFPAISDYIAPQ
jgi:hypothetical protein